MQKRYVNSRTGARTVVMAHQSRPRKKDFTTLEQHAHVLSGILERPVRYVDDIFWLRCKGEYKGA